MEARNLPYLMVLLGGLWACKDRDAVRQYREIVPAEAPQPEAMTGLPMAGPVGHLDLAWEAPSGWKRRDSALGMRAGSYSIPLPGAPGDSGARSLEISIVQLEGDAGGPEANISRWMGQVGLAPTPAGVQEFLAHCERFRTRSGQEGVFADLTTMLSGDVTRDRSVIGAIIPAGGATVFVKATGDRGSLRTRRAEFLGFCRSLRIGEGRP